MVGTGHITVAPHTGGAQIHARLDGERDRDEGVYVHPNACGSQWGSCTSPTLNTGRHHTNGTRSAWGFTCLCDLVWSVEAACVLGVRTVLGEQAFSRLLLTTCP